MPRPLRTFEVVSAVLACPIFVTAERVVTRGTKLRFYTGMRRVAEVRDVKTWAEQGLIQVILRNPAPREMSENDAPHPYPNN